MTDPLVEHYSLAKMEKKMTKHTSITIQMQMISNRFFKTKLEKVWQFIVTQQLTTISYSFCIINVYLLGEEIFFP